MRTDRVQAVLRRRNGLEAVDLGFAMARAWWRPLALSWLVLVVPFGALLVLALREHPFWAVALLWWLRPVFARVPLHVLGRALFGEEVGLRDTLRALPSLCRSGLGTSLLRQRLSPLRTFLQPVLQLEGLRGRARRERCAALSRRDAAAAVALVTVGSLITGSVVVGLLLLADLVVPEELGWDAFALLGEGEPTRILLAALYLAGISLAEPLLVAGGFGLYVNRRVYLEGWDIDLAFRQLARRLSQALRPAAAAGLALALLPALAARAEPACQPRAPESAAACIREVLAAPEFGSTREVTRFVLRELDTDLPLPSLGWLGELVASGLEVLLWTGLAAAAVSLVVLILRRRDARVGAPPARAAPATLFGLPLDLRSLPRDVVAAARACWARGERSLALSLLYRGALVHLTARAALAIPQSATELECIRLVERSQAPELARVFAELTDAWVRTRYASQPPTPPSFESLCRRFGPAFGGAP